ncbi:MAG: polysaccharide deacetylase family protein [Acidimicrobiia bacterium]|nr:polysaccharide deacetylase family protein [Acidimicrobiia bacterium]
MALIGVKTLALAADPFLGRTPGPRILIYHQVGTNLGREMEVSARSFVGQLDWIERHGTVVGLEEAVARRDDPDAQGLFALTFDDGFADVFDVAFPILQSRELPFTIYLTSGPIETGEPLDPRFPEAVPLTWDQVNEMLGSSLVTIGAHTHTHPDLRGLAAPDIEAELDNSNELIERRTGIRPQHFTYPWGWWSGAADPIVRDRYETATVGAGSGVTGASDLHQLSRLPMQRSDTRPFYGRKLAGGAPFENRVRRRLTGYNGP